MKQQDAIKAMTDGSNLTDLQATQLASLAGNLLVVPLVCALPPPKPNVVVGGGSGTGSAPSGSNAKPAAQAADNEGGDYPPMNTAITAERLVSFIAATGRVEPYLAAQVLEVVLQFIADEGAKALQAFRATQDPDDGGRSA